MKKIILVFILLVASISGNSQNLANTIWLGTHPPSLNLWFKFGTDTLYYSTSASGYTPLSTYTAASGQFSIFDIPGVTMCTDTGHYNYSTPSNNLIFTLISDNCSSRINTLVNYNWVLISTGITEIQKISGIFVFPNPGDNGIFTLSVPDFIPGKKEVVFCDSSGRIAYRQNLQTAETIFDISFLPRGIYTGHYHSDSINSTFIIMR